VIIKRHLRQKYRCACNGCVKTAPGPRKLFAKARYGINLALHIATQKYCYHLPLARQVKAFHRQGLEVTTATLWDYLSELYGLPKRHITTSCQRTTAAAGTVAASPWRSPL